LSCCAYDSEEKDHAGVRDNRPLKQLKPQQKSFEVCDQRLKGFLLRVQPSGSITYIVQCRRGKRIALGSAEVLKADEAR